jgi:hypothetical protein
MRLFGLKKATSNSAGYCKQYPETMLINCSVLPGFWKDLPSLFWFESGSIVTSGSICPAVVESNCVQAVSASTAKIIKEEYVLVFIFIT